jgi:hypothetical protein
MLLARLSQDLTSAISYLSQGPKYIGTDIRLFLQAAFSSLSFQIRVLSRNGRALGGTPCSPKFCSAHVNTHGTNQLVAAAGRPACSRAASPPRAVHVRVSQVSTK